MRRIVLLVSTVAVMLALILANALPALAAPPTFRASCITPPFGLGILTAVPQDYNEVIAFYRSCQDRGGTASLEIIPTPGAPTK